MKDYRSLIEKKTHINRDSRKYNKIEHAPVLPNNGLKFLLIFVTLILPSHPIGTNGIGIPGGNPKFRGLINVKAGKHLPYPNFETTVILQSFSMVNSHFIKFLVAKQSFYKVFAW